MGIGTEFVVQTFKDRYESAKIDLELNQPAKQTQNILLERYKRAFRHEV